MAEIFLVDFVRLVHFLGFALGIGAGAFADFSFLTRLGKKITDSDIDNLCVVHRIVWFGVGLLWASGIILLYLRTGFAPDEFTPKLVVKLLVVAALTLNAVFLSVFGLPLLRDNRGRSCLSFPLEHKTLLCVFGSLSLGSWVSGLMLGIFSGLSYADYGIFIPLFALIYGAALFGSLILAILLHVMWERGRSTSTVLETSISFPADGILLPGPTRNDHLNRIAEISG